MFLIKLFFPHDPKFKYQENEKSFYSLKEIKTFFLEGEGEATNFNLFQQLTL